MSRLLLTITTLVNGRFEDYDAAGGHSIIIPFDRALGVEERKIAEYEILKCYTQDEFRVTAIWLPE